MLLTSAQIKPKSFESRRNSFFFFFTRGGCASGLRACFGARLLPQSYQYPNLSEGADRVGGQLGGDKECNSSGVTKSGRVWRKVPESGGRSVGVSMSFRVRRLRRSFHTRNKTCIRVRGKPACTPCVRGSKVDGLWSQHFSTFLSFSPFFFFTCPFLSLFARLAFMVVARPVVMRSRGMKLGEALNKKKKKKKKKGQLSFCPWWPTCSPTSSSIPRLSRNALPPAIMPLFHHAFALLLVGWLVVGF